MSQQASLIKLKEKIEAAKRSLSEMPSLDGANGIGDGATAIINSDPSSKENAALINIQKTDAPKIFDKTVVDLPNIVALEAAKMNEINRRETTFDKAKNPFKEFHFFHRKEQLADTPITVLNGQANKNGNIVVEGNADDCLFDDFDRRLKAIEIDVAQNCLHIDELIELSSGISSPQAPVSAPKSMRRLLRRYVFWFVIGCLAMGWFALTPSGHIGIKYLLTL
ncbi:hypothetical protein N8500_07510 [Candidatus Puniceispirillum sp.]|nr:hypothetical protein [Candidatus Puniceispirillum sp.]